MNIGNLMRNSTKFKVSKQAITEYEGMIESAIEINMAILEDIVERDGKKTIMPNHITNLFNYANTTTVK